MILVDCTLRDGGYYNDWDFSEEIINSYLLAMKAAKVDVVELGFRLLKNNGFKGPCAFSSDNFLNTLSIPNGLTVAVMINGCDLLTEIELEESLKRLFPNSANDSAVKLVRIACHIHEFQGAIPAARWLSEHGYQTCFNLMQVADRSFDEISSIARMAKNSCMSVLYFADSLGQMTPADVDRIVGWIRTEWDGPIGIHTHDNLGLALANTLQAYSSGVTWLDATVAGMGRGPGNARMEELVIEAENIRNHSVNIVPLLKILRQFFLPMKEKFKWGTNPYYYLSAKFGIHPTYIQQMLLDDRYDEDDILVVIDYLRKEGGKSFKPSNLNCAKNYYTSSDCGTWVSENVLQDRDVLIIGSGPGINYHRSALEAFIRSQKPVVIALNTKSGISEGLIDYRAACHPVRLMADIEKHMKLGQPLIAPVSMMPEKLRLALHGKELLDFGISLSPDNFEFSQTSCKSPSLLVLAYALGVAGSGKAQRIFLAGFDGYPNGDSRNDDVENVLKLISETPHAPAVMSITPSSYKHIQKISVYGSI